MSTPVGPAIAPSGAITRNRGRNSGPNTVGDVSRHDVLIFFADPLSAALLGAAVELAGFAPRFAQANEGARAALLRLRPRVVLIDCDHEEACAESFVGPALMTGARVQLFRTKHSTRDADETARRLGIAIAALPMEHDALAALIGELAGPAL